MSYVNHKDDLTGISLSYLIVTGKEKPSLDNWLCRCVCGRVTVKQGFQIRNKLARSCGCKSRELIAKARSIHGRSIEGSKHYRTYYVWSSMKARCSNKNHKSYPSYGGRGIKVCRRWAKFLNFLSDMGDIPKGKTLGRIDNNKNYCPSNCRWETHKQQANNKSSNRIISFNDECLTLQQWQTKTGIHRDTIGHRLASGWTIDDALTKPTKKQKNSRERAT